MSLVDELDKLHEVQKLDARIYQRQEAIKGLNSGEAYKQAAIQLLKQHDATAEQLKKLEADQRNRELELKSAEGKRKAAHEKLYGGHVANVKELKDFQQEEAMHTARISDMEGPLLELMDQVEDMKTTLATLAGELSAAKRRWKDTVAHTLAETTRLQQEIAALRPERDQLAALVDAPLLRRYDDIRSRGDGIGMGVTGNTNCPACHVQLTSRVINLLREGEELVLCENCGRILAWIH